jgi:hypothetical protein
MADRKTARQIAQDINDEQNMPVTKKFIDTVGSRIDKIENEPGRAIATGLGLAAMGPTMIADLARTAVTGRKPRSNEDLNELTREVSRGQGQEKEKSGTEKARAAAKNILDDEKYTRETPDQKYAKGGTASSRADGIAQRGKTRGTIIK